MSVRAGLANLQRGDVGVRQAQQPRQQQGATQAEIDQYNAILESEEFQRATPVQQAATIGSWNLSPEQRAPLMAAVKANMQQQRETKKYNKFLQSETFHSMKPETQIAMVESWDLTPEQKAPVVEAIKTRVQSQKDLAAQVKAQVAFQPGEEIKNAPVFSTKYATGQYAGTSIPKRGIGFVETGQGLKAIDWKSYNPAEQEAMRGYLEAEGRQRLLNLGLFVTAPLAFVASPVTATIGAGVSVGISQTAKAIQGGGWLTPEEALTSAGEGALFSAVSSGAKSALRLTGAGLRSAAGRVVLSTGLGAAADTAGEYITTGKVTGAGALQGAAYGAAFGLIGEVAWYGVPKIVRYVRGRTQATIDASYERQIRYNEAVLSGKVKGVTEAWQPTRLERFGMWSTKVSPKGFAQQTNITRIPSGDVAFDMAAFQRVGAANELFAFGFVPKSAMQTQNIPASEIAATTSKYALHPVMFSWMEFKTDLKTAEFNAEMKQRLIERGIPESQLDVDYGGKLGFEKSPLKMEYAKDKTVRYGWEGPYQQPPSTKAGMKPIWNSVGAKTPETISFHHQLPETKAIATVRISGATSEFTGASAAPRTALKSSYSPSMWQGTPYYGAKGGLAMEETVFLSYPASGLGHPTKLAEALTFSAMAGLLPKQLSGVGARQDLAAMQVTQQLLDVPQLTETTMPMPPKMGYPTPPVTSMIRVPSGFKFEGGGFGIAPNIRRQRTRGRKRMYPILTGEEVLALW